MESNLSLKSSVAINASTGKVWEALTTPSIIKKWFLGVNTMTDWQVGSPIVHTGEWQGKHYEDKGEIVKFEPRKKSVHTHWSALSGLPDARENYQEVTWDLKEHDGKTDLTVSENNVPSEKAKITSEKTWAMVLNNLKRWSSNSFE
jgi:uncharacterized protein YndB with AHSA1/START domain